MGFRRLSRAFTGGRGFCLGGTAQDAAPADMRKLVRLMSLYMVCAYETSHRRT